VQRLQGGRERLGRQVGDRVGTAGPATAEAQDRVAVAQVEGAERLGVAVAGGLEEDGVGGISVGCHH
jgi:hypothetical protein